MSDQELITYFKNKPSNACGRFKPGQLKTYVVPAPVIVSTGFSLFRAGLLSVVMLMIVKQSQAQSKIKKVTIEHHVYANAENDARTNVRTKKGVYVTGTIIDDTDSMRLPGASIILKGTTIACVSDAEGHFEFPEQLQEGDVLQIMFVGYVSQEYVVKAREEREALHVRMAPDTMTLGEYVVGGIGYNRFSVRRLWWKLKGLFY